MPEASNRFASRRRFLIGAASALLCAPAIVRPTSLMRLRGIILPGEYIHYGFVTRLLAGQMAPVVRKHLGHGLSAHGVAVELNKTHFGLLNGWPWRADMALGIIRLDEAIQRQDAIIRAERFLRSP